jgi:predicted Zn finger-like uncharacterized protein
VSAMAQLVSCPTCQTQYQIKDELAGRKAKCKKCGQDFQIPAAQKAAVAQAASSATTTARIDGQTTIRMAAGTPVAATPVPAAAVETPPQPAEPDKQQCPHCGAWVSAGLQSCSYCRLDMHKSLGTSDSDRDREMRRSVKFSLIGIGVTLLAAPLFYLIVAMFVGKVLAMVISVILMQIGVSLGSFSLACQLFKQDPPEPSEILKIICFSNILSSVAAAALFGENSGVLAMIGGTGLAMFMAAGVCIFYVGMPVVSSMLISIVYNICAFILTFLWVMVLTLVFIGHAIVTTPAPPADVPATVESTAPQ